MLPSRYNKTIHHLSEQLNGIRPGTLSVGFIETFRHDGQPLKNLAAITSVKNRIHVIPFDRSIVNGIAKSLESSKINAYALNPTTVCVPIPPISGEQRQEMAAHIRKLGEEAKIAIRSIRQAARKGLNEDRVAEKVLQQETDEANASVDGMVKIRIFSL